MPMFRFVPFLLAMVWIPAASAQPQVTAVVNGASFEPGVAPGALVVIYGKGLASASATSPGLPLPVSLAGTSVQVNGVAAGLYYVSDTQVNAVLPAETPVGGTVPVVVTVAGVASAANRIKVDRCAPAIFTRVGNGTGRAIVFSAAYQLLDSVTPGDTVSFYATGLGATAQGADGYTRTVITPSVHIGESAAAVAYAGPSGYPGVYQVNAEIPVVLASERFFAACSASPQASNVAEIGIPEGRNAEEVTGTIEALYPKSSTLLTFSQLLTAAKFEARFRIAPGARPFPVAAVGDGGAFVFTVDPVGSRVTGSTQVPPPPERAGDFSAKLSSGLTVVDFLNNGGPIPGNRVPGSRLDPAAVTVLRAIPPPNVAAGETLNFRWERSIPAGGTVTLGEANGVGFLAAFLPIPYAPWLTARSTGFRLYVDGKLIASDKVTYALPAPPQ